MRLLGVGAVRQVPGRRMAVNGREVYLEQTGGGDRWVVFEAGSGQGRTCWDAVTPLLADQARLVAYDRAGFGRSGRTTGQLSIDDLAADLGALIAAVVPAAAPLVIVGHSMGGLVARRAAPALGPRLRGLLLLDPTPETSPIYDDFDRTVRQVDRSLAVGQALVRLRPVARMTSGNVRRVFPPDAYATMLAEDFTPAGLAQTRKELRAVAAAIRQFRAQPPTPPSCPTVVLSAARPLRRRENRALLAEHQRQYAESLPDGRYQQVDSSHFIHAEQPQLVADTITDLFTRTAGPALSRD